MSRIITSRAGWFLASGPKEIRILTSFSFLSLTSWWGFPLSESSSNSGSITYTHREGEKEGVWIQRGKLKIPDTERLCLLLRFLYGIQTDLVLMHLEDTTFFTDWRFVAAFVKQISGCYFSKSICSLLVSVSYFGNSWNVSTPLPVTRLGVTEGWDDG